MADTKIKVHRRVIRMIFPMIQRAKNKCQCGERYLFTTIQVSAKSASYLGSVHFLSVGGGGAAGILS